MNIMLKQDLQVDQPSLCIMMSVRNSR